jgi:hypothetical protein
MREVTIRRVFNGFVVQVACQTLVFMDKADMLNELENYIDRPEQTEEKFYRIYRPHVLHDASAYDGGTQAGTDAVNPNQYDSATTAPLGGESIGRRAR